MSHRATSTHESGGRTPVSPADRQLVSFVDDRIGYDFLVGTKLADFLVIIAGLFIGWVAFLYCLGNAAFWQ